MSTSVRAPHTPLERALLAVAVITVATGGSQVLAPRLMFPIVGGDTTSPTALLLFGIVGMFMVLFGGMLWQAVRAPEPVPLAVFWTGFQKLGACVAVALGVQRGLFDALALGVSAFDLLSSVLAFWYWTSIRRAPAARAAASPA